ncbi:MAG: Pentapeptide repeat protein, partial [Myxococcaceae bacterium]|nr:Pentapeptide repeat protein [Myxococcaceae bacterium]
AASAGRDGAGVEAWTRPLADRSLVAGFPFLPGSAPPSFLHRSFGEYLLAESFAVRCHRMIQPVEDVSPDARDFAPDLLARWVETAGTVEFTDETRQFLAVMLPDWEAFAQNKKRHRTGRIERWTAFEEALLHRFFTEDVAAACLPLLHRGVGRLDEVRARALLNYFAVLSLHAVTPPRRLALPDGAEAMLPQFLRWISLGYSDVVDPVTRYLSLAGRSIDVDLAQLDLMGLDLHDCDLDGCSLVGADLSDADLRGASMTFVDLTRASLRGADLRGADLRSAVFRGTLLDGADLTDAILVGVDTTAPEFARVDLRRAVLSS